MNDITRCPWSDHDDALVREYHDHEWGKLNLDERYLFEMLVLELFQSGLSWSKLAYCRTRQLSAIKEKLRRQLPMLALC